MVLPLSPARALAWMTDGTLRSRRVALVQARLVDTVGLRVDDELLHSCFDSKDFGPLAAATSEADAIAFFCNHGSSISHDRATAYAAWARSPAAAASGARSDARIYVLAGGGEALWREAELRGLPLKDLFTSWSK